MNGITTIASLPMGGGAAASMNPEVGKGRYYFDADEPLGQTFTEFEANELETLLRLGYTVNAQGIIERVKA